MSAQSDYSSRNSIDPVIVELGGSQEKTSLFLAAGLRGKTHPRLFSMQPADGQNLRRCRLAHIVNAAVADCDVAIDILFINATADHDALHNDLSHWSPFVKLGGIVILHGVSPELPQYLSRRATAACVTSIAWPGQSSSALPPLPRRPSARISIASGFC
jgi:hypothetical protein